MFASFTDPSQLSRAALRLSATLILVLAFPVSAFAQSSGGYGPGAGGGYGPGGGGGMHHRGGGGGMGPQRGGEHRMPSRSELEGPPAPAIMRDSIKLDESQVQKYAKRYADYVASTRTERDSLRTAVEAARTAFEEGDRSAARERGASIAPQWKQLSDRDKAFDKGLKDILSKDQQKRYEKWKNEREKAERAQWRKDRVPDANGQARSRQS